MVALEEEDRLSTLPDDILLDILSFLPINLAAATSVMSSRWKHLWTHAGEVYFNQSYFSDPQEIYNAFNHICQRLTSPKLDFLYLIAPFPKKGSLDNCSSCLCSSLDQISRRKVQLIYVRIDKLARDSDYEKKRLRVPASVLDNQHLVTLHLCGDLEIDMPVDNNGDTILSSVNLPNLESLALWFDYLPYELLEKLIHSCPKLKYLRVSGEIRGSTRSFYISSEKLEYLCIFAKHDDGEFIIDTPNLKHLDIRIYGLKNYRFVSKPILLLSADIALDWELEDFIDSNDSSSQPLEILQYISGVKILTIAAKILKAVQLMYHDGECPFFKNVTHFDINMDYAAVCWNNSFLYARYFPSLEFLEVSHSWEYKLVESDLNVLNEQLARLKVIKLERLRGTSDDIGIIKYILNNADTLELLIVGCHIVDSNMKGKELWHEYKFCREVFLLPIRSVNCEIQFHGEFLGLQNFI